MTNNAGLSWTKIDDALPLNLSVMSLAVDWRSTSATIYAGTTRGVFFSTDLGIH